MSEDSPRPRGRDRLLKATCPTILRFYLPGREVQRVCDDLEKNIHSALVHSFCYDLARRTASEFPGLFEEDYDACCKKYGCGCDKKDR